MRRGPLRAGVACLAVFAAGLVATLAVSAVDTREQAFTLGVEATRPVARLGGGDTVCQRPIDAAAAFDAVALTLAVPLTPAPPVTVRVIADGRTLAGGSAGGYGPGASEVVVPLARVEGGRRISVCLTAGGREGEAAVYGGSGLGARGSAAVENGRRLRSDVEIAFLRDPGVSLLSLAPEMVRRASLFHGAPVGQALVWLVLALLVTAVPALLALAVVKAGEPDEPEPEEDLRANPLAPARR